MEDLMGVLIEVDFVSGEVLHGTDEVDREVGRMWEDYHRAVELGGVAFPELNEEFARLARAVSGR